MMIQILCPECAQKAQRKMNRFQQFCYYFKNPLFPFAKSITQCPQCGKMHMLSHIQCVMFGVFHTIMLTAIFWVRVIAEPVLPDDILPVFILQQLIRFISWLLAVQISLAASKTLFPWECIEPEDLLIWGDKGNKRLLLATFISYFISFMLLVLGMMRCMIK